MVVIPNYAADHAEYEHVTIRVLVTAESGGELQIPDHYPFARCSICDEPVFTVDVDTVHDAVEAHRKKHH